MSEGKLPEKNQASKTPKQAPKTSVAPKQMPKTGVTPKPSGIKPTMSKPGVPKSAPKSNTTATKPTNKGGTTTDSKTVKPTRVASSIKPSVKSVDTANVAVKAEDGDKGKKKKRLLLILLLLLLFISVIGVSIYLVAKNAPVPEINFTIQVVSSDVKTEIFDENDQSITQIKFLPGDPIEANLKIKIVNEKGTISTSESVFLRFRIDVQVEENSYYNFFDPVLDEIVAGEKWTSGDRTLTEFDRGKSFDGYYYYNTKCYGGEEIKALNGLDFVANRDNNVLNGKTGKVIFTIEILQGDHSAINEYWQTAPTSWRRRVR